MKNTFKNFGLVGLFLISIFGVVSFVNGDEKIIRINTNPPIDSLHKLHLHSLYLLSGNNDSTPTLIKSNKDKNLDIPNGLIVGNNANVGGSYKLITIGGGKNNTINESYAGIAGGGENIINGKYSAIGGGQNNTSNGENSVVAGGQGNTATNGGIVAGGINNGSVDYSAVLGGQNNTGKSYSLIIGGNGSKNTNEGFAWNRNNVNKSAGINANSGVLIGTLNPIDNVSLVVSGAVKIGEKTSNENNKGKIFNSGGCIDVYYDNNQLRTLGKTSEISKDCQSSANTCKFGKSIFQIGDATTGYTEIYTGNCDAIAKHITCNDSSSFEGYYPYCYEISNDPFLD